MTKISYSRFSLAYAGGGRSGKIKLDNRENSYNNISVAGTGNRLHHKIPIPEGKNMKKIITAVYDKKQKTFNFGIVAEDSTIQAIRNFEQACFDKRSILNMYPDDFTLYQIGEFETTNGKIKTFKEPVVLTHATDYVNKNKDEVK